MEQITSEEKNIAMMSHLLCLFFGVVPALLIWLLKKDESEFINKSAKEALNFQITYIIYTFIIVFASIFISIITLGFGVFLVYPLIFVLIAIDYVFIIIASIEVNKGNHYEYPLTIRIIK